MPRKNLLLILLFAVMPALMWAQPELIWAKQLGSKDNLTSAPSDKGTGIVTDGEGNVYITGVFWGKSDFDPGPGTYYLQSAGVSDIFVCKLDKSGNLVWAKKMGGANYHNSNGIAIDHKGYLYITGCLQGTTTFSSTTTIQPSGYKDAFVCKLDTSGSLIWVSILGGIQGSMDQNEGMAIAVDDSGHVYSIGQMYYGAGGIDLDPGPDLYYLNSAGDLDLYVSKLDSNGQFIWGRTFGGTNREFGKAICVDNTGNAYLSGSFVGKVDFDPGDGQYFLQSQVGNQDAFLCKLDPSGSLAWAKQIGGGSTESGNALGIDPKGDILLAGVFGGPVDFDPDTSSFILSGSNASTFVSKFTPEGKFKWARHFNGRNVAYGLCSDQRGNIYLTGEINSGNGSSSDFDPGPGEYLISLPYNSPDIYIAKLDTSGWLITAGTMGGANGVAVNKGFSVATDAAENLFATGQYAGTTPDFDPDRTPGAVYFLPTSNMDDEDIFVGKYGTLTAPIAGFSSKKQVLCQDECITFLDESIGAETWSWSFEGGSPAQSDEKDPGSICYADTGTFKVSLIVSSNGLSDSSIREAYIHVYSINAAFSLESSNLSYLFHAEQDSLAGISYHWDFGDGTYSAERNPEHTFQANNRFDVCLIVKLSTGCNDSSCSSIETSVTQSQNLSVQKALSSWRYDASIHGLRCNNCKDNLYTIQANDLAGRLVIPPTQLSCINGIISLPGNVEPGSFLLISIRNGREVSVVSAIMLQP